MTPEQKQLVQTSFAQVLSIADIAAEMFYTQLFRMDPKLKGLFTGEMREQGQKLMYTIRLAVAGLDRLGRLVPALETMGRRHAEYGVEDKDYETVGAAFIATLERGLGPGFTPEIKEAWIAVYRLLAAIMRAAAKTHVPVRMYNA